MDRPFKGELEEVLWFCKLPFGLQSSGIAMLCPQHCHVLDGHCATGEPPPYGAALCAAEEMEIQLGTRVHQGKSGLTGWHAFEKRS